MSQVLQREATPAPMPRLPGLGSWWHRLLHGVRRLYTPRADWSDYVGEQWADHIMQADLTDDINKKQGRSTGRWLLEAHGKHLGVYLKRHYELPRWLGLLAALWPRGDWSPGMQECNNLEWRGRWAPRSERCCRRRISGPLGEAAQLPRGRGAHRYAPLAPGDSAGRPSTRRADFSRLESWASVEIARLCAFCTIMTSFTKTYISVIFSFLVPILLVCRRGRIAYS